MAEEKKGFQWGKIFGERKWLLILVAAAAVLLLVMGGEHTDKATDTAAAVQARTEAYRKDLEKELADLCGRLYGVGGVSVMITLDGSERAVYAADARGDGKSDYVVSGGQGLLISHEYPAVIGAAIVCEGASAAVCEEVARLASAVLGVGLNRIYVGVG